MPCCPGHHAHSGPACTHTLQGTSRDVKACSPLSYALPCTLQGFSAGEQRLATPMRAVSSVAGSPPALSLATGGGCINSLALSPDGRLIAAACEDGALRLFDFSSGRPAGGFRVRHYLIAGSEWKQCIHSFLRGGTKGKIARLCGRKSRQRIPVAC